jgi:hypothetical protein
MKTDAQSLMLLLGGAGFCAYLLLKLFVGLGQRDTVFEEARKRMVAAKRRGKDRSLSTVERAAALRDAASLALEGLQRPGLAAAFARRAERLDPGHSEAISLLVLALRRGARYSALERLLWQQLADAQSTATPGYRRTFDELVGLYDGPLHRPDTARALRRLQSAP